ncbi:hypothetical protein NLJ89_g5026 [Agrocybe chaxingu]|uniref:Uncharacterized protein n=1 Tax=Agrocybe chaxingu TaxID=84603 RepID=A0A9W8K221_9AGAR|nr:hypothetical protein NLJ89_g5026 [Agrocybe chaxingu]
MQFKKFGDAVHLSGPFQLVWNRISFSRLTLIYFFFSFAHFIIQLSFQIKAFTINADASNLLSRIVNEAQTTNNSLPILRDSDLRMCSWVPANLNVLVDSCKVIWSDPNAEASTNAVGSFPSPLPPATASTTVSATSSVAVTSPTGVPSVNGTRVVVDDDDEDDDDDNDEDDDKEDEDEEDDRKRRFIRRDMQIIASQDNGAVSVTLKGLPQGEVVLNESCLWTLNWPVSVLGNTKREDIVFIAFQFWVLAMSIVALLNESIPHILASLVTHMMATAWTAFQITHTANFRSNFNRVITNGACRGVALLPNYWDARSKAEIPSLTFNVLSLLISCFLTWKLVKLFGWQTFKRVGASLTINRVYKFVLFLSITIQLSLFFMVVTVSLWIDQLMNSVIGDLVDHQTLYKVASFITLVMLIPWLTCGWFGVRRELRLPMFVFLVLSILYLGGWGVMFFSTTFRWTFITWRFFSIMAAASVFLTCLAIVLGVTCRFNFGKGLARYLNAHQSLPDDDFPVPYTYNGSDVEKVAFPSSEKPLPTYASYDDFAPSTYSGSTMGPRFSNKSAEPFETSIPNVPYPAPALKRTSNEVQVKRHPSYGSTRSNGSLGSSGSHARSDSGHSHGSQVSHSKRWVIE